MRQINKDRGKGDPLVKGEDAGGVRWFLAGEPIHCGQALELLLETDSTFDSETGAVTGFTPVWLRVRFEMHDGAAYVYLPSTGLLPMCAKVMPRAQFRWPADRWEAAP